MASGSGNSGGGGSHGGLAAGVTRGNSSAAAGATNVRGDGSHGGSSRVTMPGITEHTGRPSSAGGTHK